MLIVIEGPDGCGKSSLVSALAVRLNATSFAFPNYQNETGPLIRDYLRGKWHVIGSSTDTRRNYASAMTFQSLQVANKLEEQAWLRRIEGHATNHVILDRYWQSGHVYGILDGLSPQWIASTSGQLVEPDLSILVSVTANTALQRMKERGGAPEIYEGDRSSTMRQIALYQNLWSYKDSRWQIIDGERPFKDVADQAHRLIQEVIV